MNVDFDHVLAFAKSLEGRDLHTQARKKAFRVCVVGDRLEFTPESTGKPRPLSRTINQGQQVLDRYNLTRSLKPGDYQDITYNSSYLLTLIGLMVGSERQG